MIHTISICLSTIHPTYTGVIAFVIALLTLLATVSVLAGEGGVQHKCLWTAAILFLPVIGLILYVVVGRSSQDRPLLE